MVISILKFDPRGQFQSQKVITSKFTQITKMMSDLNSFLFPLFKDTLLFQIGPLVQRIWGFEVGHPPLFSLNFQKINPPYLGNQSSDQLKILDLRFECQNQHVCQISLNSERVGFRIFLLGDLTWNDPAAKQNYFVLRVGSSLGKRNLTYQQAVAWSSIPQKFKNFSYGKFSKNYKVSDRVV